MLLAPRFSSLFLIMFSMGVCLTILLPTEAFAIGDSELREQVTAVDKAFKSFAHIGLWAVIVVTGAISLYKQNLIGVAIAGAGAIAISQLSSWVQAVFAYTI